VAIAALKGDKTLAELTQQLGVHSNQITDWKSQLLDQSAKSSAAAPDLTKLQAKIGQLILENVF